MNNMVNLIIDGISIQAEAGSNLIDVAKENKIIIPTFVISKKSIHWQLAGFVP